MDCQVLNFKRYDSGALVGFFDLEVCGLCVTGCKAFSKGEKLWFGWPSEKMAGDDGEAAYRDIVSAADPLMRHLQGLVRGQLRALLAAPAPGSRQATRPPVRKWKTPEGEDLSAHLSGPPDDIPY